MKRNDIDKVFSQKVLEYLTEGYIIHTPSMAGNQGEEGKIDFIKGDTLIRVWIEKEFLWNSESDQWYGNTLVLRVGKWNHPAHQTDNYSVVWMKDFDILEKITYYEVGQRSSFWYVDNLEEALSTREKMLARRFPPKNSREENVHLYNEEWAKDLAVKYLKRKVGYSRVSRDKVRLFHDRRKRKYYVGYNLHNYELR